MRTLLYAHNKTVYEKVMQAFETSDRTCVVHPTGTGKSYLIAAVSKSYKKVLILGPNIFVLDQVHDVLKWRKRGVVYMTYALLMCKEEIPKGYDLICLDEFHRAGAPEWGEAIDKLLEANPQAKVFGTTATHIRYLDDERNMADELFGGNIASHITIAEAWTRKILPIPRYVCGLFRWDKTLDDVKERISRSRSLTDKEKRERIFRLTNAHLHWELSYGMPTILKKHLDSNSHLCAMQTHSLTEFFWACVQAGKFCRPLIDINGGIHMSESWLCPTVANVSEGVTEAFRKMRVSRPCKGCQLYKNFERRFPKEMELLK